MTNQPQCPQDNTGAPRYGLLLGGGAAVLMILCCAGPALIASGAAAGALAVLVGWLANSWGIGLAAVAAVFVIVGLARRIRSGGGDDCRSSAAPSLDDSTTPGHTLEQERLEIPPS